VSYAKTKILNKVKKKANTRRVTFISLKTGSMFLVWNFGDFETRGVNASSKLRYVV